MTDAGLIDAVRTLGDMATQHSDNEASHRRHMSPDSGIRTRTKGGSASDTGTRGVDGGAAEVTMRHRQTLYSPRSIALVSPVAAVACMEECLRQLYNQAASGHPRRADRQARELVSHVPLPLPGWTVQFGWARTIALHMPGVRSLPMFQYSLIRLFSVISIETLLEVFTCALLEHRILLLSRDCETLMLVAETVTALLYVVFLYIIIRCVLMIS